VTPRTVDSLTRLATAHAKARLSSKVETRDVVAAEEILRYALFDEVPQTDIQLSYGEVEAVRDDDSWVDVERGSSTTGTEEYVDVGRSSDDEQCGSDETKDVQEPQGPKQER
jgi:DNA replication licensing factor MCM3